MKVIFYNIVIFAGLFVVLELTTRIFFSEYSNAYYSSEITRGNRIYKNIKWGNRVSKDQINADYQRRGNEFRVLFIGDSVTFGYGVSFRETYHAIANKEFSESGCDLVINGVGQYHSNLEQIMTSNFREFILHGYDPDIVIYQFNVNDLDRFGPPKKSSVDELTLREKFEKFRLSYLNRSAFLKAIQSATMRIYQRSQQVKLNDSLHYSGKSNPELYEKQWHRFESSLLNTKDTLSRLGVKFAVLLVPESIRISSSDVDNDFHIDTSGIELWPGEKVAEIASRHDIPAIDVTPQLLFFRQENPEERIYLPNDMNHPNETGHKLISNVIVRELPTLANCNEN